MLKRMKHRSVTVLLLILFSFTLLPSHRALAYIPQMPFDDLVHLADIVFIGTVSQQNPKIAKNNRLVETEIVFEQVELLHQRDTVTGKIGKRITLTHSGGRFNEAFTYVSDMPRLETGTRYLVLAHYDGQNHVNPFVGGNQGLFRIATDEVTGRQYPLRVNGAGIAGLQGERPSLTRPVRGIRGGLPEWREPATKIKRASPPQAPTGWLKPSRSAQTAPTERLLDLGELQDHVRKTLEKSPSPSAEKMLRKRAAENLSRTAAAAPEIPPKRHAWEFTPDGKVVILDPAKVKCRTPRDQAADSTGALNYSRTPQGGTSREDISIYGWHNLPVILDMMPESYWTHQYDIQALSIYNQYIRGLIEYRNWDGSFSRYNDYSEMWGFLTDAQERNIGVNDGWQTAIARTHLFGGACQSCEIFEADISFKAEEKWTGDHDCQLYRNVPGLFGDACLGANLYLPVAVHEMGHTLGLMNGGEDYMYDIPTVMNGGLENAVDDGRGLHVGDTYLLRYWYADQRNDDQMKYDDIGVESWIAENGTKNATTDKAVYSPGEQIVISNAMVENPGRHAAPNVRLRAYLSNDTNLNSLINGYNELDLGLIPADRLLIGPPPSNLYYEWPVLEHEAFWTGELAFTIPPHIPSGRYRIHLVVTANNDQSTLIAAPGDTSYHEVTAHNNHTFLYNQIEVACPKPAAPANFKTQGSDGGGVGLVWDAVSGATHYKVLRHTANNSAAATVLTETLTVSTYKDTSAVPTVHYYYWVAAKNGCQTWGDLASLGSATWSPLATPCIQSATDGTSTDEVQAIARRVDQGNYYCFYYNTVNNPATATQMPGECWTTDTSALHTDGAPGQTYFYFVKAATSSSGTNVTPLGGACADDNTGWRKLLRPGAVAATTDRSDGIYVTWTATSGATTYRVYRNTEQDPATAVPIREWSRDLRSVLDTNVEPERQYYYWVRAAVGSDGERPSDFSVAALGSKAYSPAPRVDMTGYGATKGESTAKVTIAWNPVYSPVYTPYYRIYRSSESDNPNTAVPISGWQPGTSFDDTTGIPGKDYWYWVSSAHSADGLRESSWQFCPGCWDLGWRKLSSAPDVAASNGKMSDRIRITWSPAEGATHYKVYRSTLSSPVTKPLPTLISPVVSGTQFDDTDPALVARTTYYYWVRSAVDETGSRESGFHMTGVGGWKAAAEPSGPGATDGVYTDKVRITWSAVSGLNQYQIYRNTVNDPVTAKPLLTAWQTATTFDDKSALPGVLYYYWVQGRVDRNDLKPGLWSEAATGYRALPPTTGTQASDGAFADKVRVTWSDTPGGPYYRVYRNTSATLTGARAVSGWTQALAFDDTVDLEAGVTYHYLVVSAANSRGELPGDPGAGDTGYRGLAPPVDLLVTKGTFYKSVGVSWNPGAPEATHYRVYRSQTNSAGSAQPVSGWQTGFQYDDASVTPDVVYYYWVTGAIDQNGTAESAPSNGGRGEIGYATAEIPGDVDGNGRIELNDAILALKVITGSVPTSAARTALDVRSDPRIRVGADINGDAGIGLAEAMYVLNKIAFQEIPAGE